MERKEEEGGVKKKTTLETGMSEWETKMEKEKKMKNYRVDERGNDEKERQMGPVHQWDVGQKNGKSK